LRYSSAVWPPPGLPSLPRALAGFNTFVLTLSSLALARAIRAMRTLDAVGLRRGLWLSFALGVLFLVLQVVQWTRLLAHGLGFAGTTYGTTFYLMTGAHAAHAAVGIVWLFLVTLRQRELWVPDRSRVRIEICALYWHFV